MKPEQQAALAAPFPDELVQWRPGSAIGSHYPECQRKQCRETRDPSKHMQLAYVEDETVMDRLDEVLGVGGWSFKVDSMGDGAVRGTLVIHESTSLGDTQYQDFGYPANGLEPLKEATTDAFRRCGRMVGVARYIYAGHLEQAPEPSPRPAAPARGEGTPRPSPAPVLDLDNDEEWAGLMDAAIGPTDDGGHCPAHNVAWTHKPAGTSKAGKPYAAFWACSEKNDDGSYCREKPSHEWAARHAA